VTGLAVFINLSIDFAIALAITRSALAQLGTPLALLQGNAPHGVITGPAQGTIADQAFIHLSRIYP
jgi:hypothetical protein